MAHLLACDNCVLDAIVHPTLILLADITIALKTLDLASKASGEVITGEILDLSYPTLSLCWHTSRQVRQKLFLIHCRHQSLCLQSNSKVQARLQKVVVELVWVMTQAAYYPHAGHNYPPLGLGMTAGSTSDGLLTSSDL